MSDTHLSPLGRAYVGCVIVAGSAAILQSIHSLYVHPVSYQWLILAALTLVSGSFTVKVPSVPSWISVSETFVIISVLLFGRAPATLIVAIEGIVISLWLLPNARELYRVFFNMASAALAIWLAATLLSLLGNLSPTPPLSPVSTPLLIRLALFTLAYFILNSSLIAAAVAFERRQSFLVIWRTNFAWLSLNYFVGASVAALLLPYTDRINLTTLGLIVPLLLLSYLAFKTTLGRVEDANKHLHDLNQLYLSTIETLAMAIDAKDQITHGHIRRVQLYAGGLAKAVGLREAVLIRALEAAALLHDMGKLAVPEYILNKPGKLTPAEFDKMKLHASVGADILSAINFPYPVVPIVRHHHENWDGTGYPAGLAGTDIPIGARILAVVDCFDALTSDRPYRPKLAAEEALAILHDRRGTMYDPLMVDTFVKVYREIAPLNLDTSPQRQAFAEITRSAHRGPESLPTSGFEDISASTEEMLSLYDLARSLAGQAGLADTADVIAKHLRRIVPASLCAFYLYDTGTDDLVAAHVVGEGEEVFRGIRVRPGERLTGWVAANRQTIVNSDPVLDFGDIGRTTKPRLRSCLSTPLLADDSLVGVLSLYSTATNAFTEDHRRIIEVVARQISRTVRDAREFDRLKRSSLRDSVTGLPNVEHLKQFLASDAGLGDRIVSALALVFLDIVDLKGINLRFGRPVGDRALAHVVTAARRALRGGDIIFRYGSDEFVVLLPTTDRTVADSIAERIAVVVRDTDLSLDDGTSIYVSIVTGTAGAPADGTDLVELVARARARLRTPDDSNGKSRRLTPGIH